MKFKELIAKYKDLKMYGFQNDFRVEGLASNSKQVRDNYIFFAIKGFKEDGNKFITEAIKNGAKAVVTSKKNIEELKNNFKGFPEVIFIYSDEVRKLMALISSEFYGKPSKSLRLIGITGTNGKSTIVYLLKKILEDSGKKCGLIGTIEYIIGDEKYESVLTTPDSIEIHSLLKKMLDKGMEYCVMEVSSIALVNDRVYGLEFEAGVFTNLSREHLDLHYNMENYFNAKKILFDSLGVNAIAVSNRDDEYGVKILNDCTAKKIFYSIDAKSNFRAVNEKLSIESINYDIQTGNKLYSINSELKGRFNIYNTIAGFSLMSSLGFRVEDIIRSIKEFKPVNGRFNTIKLPNDAYAVIDYSHTSDSLKNAIESAIEIRKSLNNNSRIITVFGCGGNKDKTKRPIMGKYATELSDYVIITSDNPRYEEPMSIISEIITGINAAKNYEIEADREKAIKKSIEMSSENDIILICGKGHETYQDIKGVKYHFNDKEIIEKYSALAKK